MRKLDHPNIVNYHAVYDDKEHLYIVMELCQENLQEREDIVNIKEKTAAHIAYKLIEALNHAHSCGVVHRDVKPENVMFGEDDDVRLVDFGLATVNLKDKNEEVGSPLFMAPELFEEKGKISGKCDIWATGILLYEMLTKKLPYHGESIHELRVAVQ